MHRALRLEVRMEARKKRSRRNDSSLRTRKRKDGAAPCGPTWLTMAFSWKGEGRGGRSQSQDSWAGASPLPGAGGGDGRGERGVRAPEAEIAAAVAAAFW